MVLFSFPISFCFQIGGYPSHIPNLSHRRAFTRSTLLLCVENWKLQHNRESGGDGHESVRITKSLNNNNETKKIDTVNKRAGEEWAELEWYKK